MFFADGFQRVLIDSNFHHPASLRMTRRHLVDLAHSATVRTNHPLYVGKQPCELGTVGFIVVDHHLLSCSEDDIKDTRGLRTYIDGKLVYQAKPSRDR